MDNFHDQDNNCLDEILPNLDIYIVGLVDKTEEEAFTLLKELSDWQGKEEFVYTHKWQPQMLVMWDNRALLHRATGGHEGEDRLLHRTTIAAY